MAEFGHLTDEKLEHVTNRPWEVESSLRGPTRPFQYKEDIGGVHFDTEEFFGIGQLLSVLSREISIQEDILKCGYDTIPFCPLFIQGGGPMCDHDLVRGHGKFIFNPGRQTPSLNNKDSTVEIESPLFPRDNAHAIF